MIVSVGSSLIHSIVDRWLALVRDPELADQEQTRIASLLHKELLVLLVAALVLVLMALILSANVARFFVISGALLLLSSGLLVLNHRGHTRAVAILLNGLGFVMTAGAAWTEGGIHSPAVSGFFGIVLSCALMLGTWWGIGAAASSVAMMSVLAYAEHVGMLPASSVVFTPFSFVLSLTFVLFIIVTIQSLSAKSLSDALRQAKAGLQERNRADEQLRANEAILSAVLNTTKDFILSFDRQMKITAVNRPLADAVRSRFGIEVAPGMSAFDAADPQRRQQLGELYRRALSGESLAHVHEEEGKEQTRRFFVESLYPIRTGDGMVQGVTVYTRDMTEWIRMDTALRESEERLRTVVSNVPVIIFALDKQGIFRLSEGKGLRSLGLKPGQVVGQSAREVYRDYPRVIEGIDRAMIGESLLATVEVGPTVFETYYSPLLGPDGKVNGVIGVATDITDQRRSTEKLREQASLLDRAHDAILVKDVEGKITYWNREAERLYGWQAEDALGRDEAELLCDAAERQNLRVARSATIATGEWNGELVQHTRSGIEILVDSRWTLITNDSGEPRSILSINIDMTEKKSLERQLIRSQRLEGLGTLAGGIAHDLNNVLTPILMSIEGLRMRHSEPKTVRALDTIEAGAQRGADIIKQLLTFARGMKGDFVSIHLRHILKDLERILRSTFPKSIQLRVQVIPGLWSIVGDSTQIHQVLLNLCVNARDAMEQGGILSLHATNELLTEGEARMNPDARPGQYVRMSVGDTGCGIPKENLEKIFDPFFTTKDVGKGTGLGLSTVSTIVKNHRGFIKVYSEAGKGSAFSVYLPAIMDDSVSDGQALIADVARGSGELILVVDDEEFVRDVAQETLAAAGYRVLLASDGVEARKILSDRGNDVSLVVTDVMMPNMDGVALVKTLQAEHPSLRISAMSGMIASEKLDELTQLGIDRILNKPFTSGDFARFVHVSLSKKA